MEHILQHNITTHQNILSNCKIFRNAFHGSRTEVNTEIEKDFLNSWTNNVHVIVYKIFSIKTLRLV